MFYKVVAHARTNGFIPAEVHRIDPPGFASFWRLHTSASTAVSIYAVRGRAASPYPIQVYIGKLVITPAKAGSDIQVQTARGALHFDSSDPTSRRQYVALVLAETIKVFNVKIAPATSTSSPPTLRQRAKARWARHRPPTRP
jgi:hypothetical protein